MIRKRRRGGPRRGPADVPPIEWRNPNYLKFLRTDGWCLICGPYARPIGECDPCHGPVNGTSSKGPDSGAIPLCRRHHTEQHEKGWPRMEREYHFSRQAAAARWWEAFCINRGIAQKKEVA